MKNSVFPQPTGDIRRRRIMQNAKRKMKKLKWLKRRFPVLHFAFCVLRFAFSSCGESRLGGEYFEARKAMAHWQYRVLRTSAVNLAVDPHYLLLIPTSP